MNPTTNSVTALLQEVLGQMNGLARHPVSGAIWRGIIPRFEGVQRDLIGQKLESSL